MTILDLSVLSTDVKGKIWFYPTYEYTPHLVEVIQGVAVGGKFRSPPC